MDDGTFDYIMLYYYTNGYDSVEANPSHFEKFGVIEDDMQGYIGNSTGFSSGDVSGSIQSELSSSTGNGPAFLKATPSANTSHLVVYVGYELYDDDWNNQNSVIYIMDPDDATKLKKIYRTQLINDYENIYQ